MFMFFFVNYFMILCLLASVFVSNCLTVALSHCLDVSLSFHPFFLSRADGSLGLSVVVEFLCQWFSSGPRVQSFKNAMRKCQQ